jgi:alpha-1,3-rhamnosyl/mannosyltransferase
VTIRALHDLDMLPFFPRGGTAVYVVRLLRALLERKDAAPAGACVSLRPRVRRRVRSVLRREVPDLPLAFVPLPGRVADALGRGSVRFLPGGMPRPDVVHGTNYLLPRWLAWPGVPGVLTVHDLAFLDLDPDRAGGSPGRSGALGRRLGGACREAAAVLTPSAHTRRAVLRHFEVDPAAVFVSPLALQWNDRGGPAATEATGSVGSAPADADAALLREWDCAPGEYVLSVGQLNPRKNVPALLGAFRALREADPAARLLVAGPAGWQGEAIASRIGECGGARWLGPVSPEALRVLYRNARVFALLSWDEGFGIPVLEAMSTGCPVLCTSGSALEEVAGGAARLVPPGDAAAAGEALRDLWQDADRRASMAEAGRRRAERFAWSMTAERTMAAYRFACGAGPGAAECGAEAMFPEKESA